MLLDAFVGEGGHSNNNVNDVVDRDVSHNDDDNDVDMQPIGCI